MNVCTPSLFLHREAARCAGVFSTFPAVWKAAKPHADRGASGQEANEGWWLMVGMGCICCKAVLGTEGWL